MTKKIAISSDDGVQVGGHAGQARHWLVYEPEAPLEQPTHSDLDRDQVLHLGKDSGPHPLDGID